MRIVWTKKFIYRFFRVGKFDFSLLQWGNLFAPTTAIATTLALAITTAEVVIIVITRGF